MNCENPQRIYNKYLERFILVPCGKCDSCRITFSNSLSTRVWNECNNHPFNIFCTLTYKNDEVPFITPDCQKIRTLSGRLDLDILSLDEKYQKSLELISKNYPYRPLTKHSVKCSVGVLYKKDIQNFFKRLRSSIYYEFKEKFTREVLAEKTSISFFAVGEYGTDYKRPHFHCILHCDDESVAEFVRVSILSCWRLCDWNALREFEVKTGKKVLPSYIKGRAAANYVSAYVSCLDGSSDIMEQSNFKSFCTFSKRPLYGCTKVDREILQEFVRGNFDTEVHREVTEIVKGELRTSVSLFSQNFLRSLFPRFNGIDSLSYSDKLRLCVDDSRNKQKHNFFTKCRSFCVKYLGGYNFANIVTYLEIYERFTSRVKSYLLRDFMKSFKKNNPLEYIKNCYHTFEDDPNRLFFGVKLSILEQFGIDLIRFPISLNDFGNNYFLNLNQRKTRYHNRLLPKHFNNKFLNYCYYG